jgi:hypothetical protein
MRIEPGRILTLGTAVLASACAAGTGMGADGGMQVVIAPPEVTCPGGALTSFAVADSVAGRLVLMNTLREDARPAAFLAAQEQARRAVTPRPANACG